MKRFLLVTLLLSVVWSLSAQDKALAIRNNLLQEGNNSVLVVSHRADWRNAPENSLQAIRNCIEMGVDMVMQLCKGKIMVNVDKGYDYFNEAYAILEKNGTTRQCIMKASLPYERVKAEHGDILQKMIFMPVVALDKEGAEDIIDGYMAHMKPMAYELVFSKDTPEIQRLIKKVRASGAKIFINSLWPELCGGHDDDRAVEQQQPDESWGWIIGQGAKLIQTDRPALLIEYLKEKGFHN